MTNLDFGIIVVLLLGCIAIALGVVLYNQHRSKRTQEASEFIS